MLVPPSKVLQVPGGVKIVDFHLMNNKRFALTVDEAKKVKLWKLDDLEVVKEFDQSFNDAKQMLQAYDMQHSRENPLPQSWCSLDIKLGVSNFVQPYLFTFGRV